MKQSRTLTEEDEWRSASASSAEPIKYVEGDTYDAATPRQTGTLAQGASYRVAKSAKAEYIVAAAHSSKEERARFIREANKRLARW